MWGVWDILVIAMLACIERGFTILVSSEQREHPSEFAKFVPICLLCICVVVQMLDLSNYVKQRRGIYVNRQQEYTPLVDVDKVGSLLQGKEHLVIIDGESGVNAGLASSAKLEARQYYDLAQAVLDNHATLNDFYYSRRDSNAIELEISKAIDALDNDNPTGDTLYCFASAAAKRYESCLTLQEIDGLWFGVAK